MYDVWEAGVHGLSNGEATNNLETKTVWTEGRIIQIGDYVKWKQPYVWRFLERQYLCYLVDWKAIMEEAPKPGRGGLMPGEVEANG